MDWEAYKNIDNTLTIFVIYNLICIIFLMYVVRLSLKSTGLKYDVIFPITLILSIPFCATSIQRGNAVMLVAIILSLFYLWMEDASKLKQEIAMVLLAIAAGFKVYPAICGILYLKRKDYPKILRCLLYGIILFFCPFALIGGVQGLKSLIEMYIGRETGAPNDCTVRGEVIHILQRFSFLSETAKVTISVSAEIIFFVILLICFLVAESRWQESLFLSGILSVCIPSNHMYTSVYFLAPLLMFLAEYNEEQLRKDSKLEIFSCFLFGMVFSLPVYFILFWNTVYLGTFAVIYLLLFGNICSVLLKYIKKHMQWIQYRKMA